MRKYPFVKEITRQSFKKYGVVIEYPNSDKKGKTRNLWRIVHRSASQKGWRIAYLILRDKSLGCLQCHSNTDETFEPIRGKAVLFLSDHKDFNYIEAFWLDKPIVVYKGIWHGVISVNEEVHMKIFENNQFVTESFPLNFRLNLDSFAKLMK